MSTVVPVQFALFHRGITFGGKLQDENGNVRNLTGFTELQVILTKPDGTKITKDSFVDGTVLETPGNPTNSNIIWIDTGVSILDQLGHWSVSVAARFSNDSFIPSYQEIGFWVV